MPGKTSWKGYNDHFERIAGINGWMTNAENVQYLTISLENPASDVLRDILMRNPRRFWDVRWSEEIDETL